MEQLVKSKEQLFMSGPKSEELLDSYSTSSMQDHTAPHLFHLLTALVVPPMRYDTIQTASIKDSGLSVTYTMANLLKHRTDRAMGLPMMIAFLLISNGTSKQVSRHFLPTDNNHTSLRLSIQCTHTALYIQSEVSFH